MLFADVFRMEFMMAYFGSLSHALYNLITDVELLLLLLFDPIFTKVIMFFTNGSFIRIFVNHGQFWPITAKLRCSCLTGMTVFPGLSRHSFER